MINHLSILNNINEGACLIKIDGEVLFWNHRLEDWSQIRPNEIIGQNIFERFERFQQPHIQARIQMLIENKVPLVFSAQLHQYLIPCPLTQHTFRFQQTVLTLLDDEQFILVTTQDFTEHLQRIETQKATNQRLFKELRQREKLEQSNQRLIAAINQAAEAIIITNQQGLLQYTNATFSKQTGWSSEQALELYYEKLLPVTDSHAEQHIVNTIRSGQSWQGRQELLRKDGTTFTANVSIAPIINDDGSSTHTVAIQEDITQQLALEEQYRQTQKQQALTTLVGGIAHDFNNLLSGILGHLYLAAREVKELPKTAQRLEKIQKSAYEAADIVKQLMTFARRDQMDVKSFPMQSFLKEISKLLEHHVPENIKFTLDFELGSFNMHGDPDQLQQTIVSLVHNAVEACTQKTGAHIELKLEHWDKSQDEAACIRHPVLKLGTYAHLLVRDNGCGIHPDHCERIFDPFFTTKQIGSGLGLAMVMGCILHHHGIIEVDSKLEQGSCFHIYLPLQSQKDHQQSAIVTVPAKHATRILLVDDDPLVRETCAELLSNLGHNVTTAIDGQDAVEIFNQYSGQFELIIMDMVMPRLSGPAAMRHIRQLDADVPVIFATAYDQSISLKEAEQFQQSILVSKPFNPDNLLDLIRSMRRPLK